MKHSYTAVVERAHPLVGDFVTEPYEAGWASEAVVFITVRDGLPEGAFLDARVQVSPDGIQWTDEGTAFDRITMQGTNFARVNHFGNWLRVAGSVSDPSANVLASIYFSLKE